MKSISQTGLARDPSPCRTTAAQRDMARASGVPYRAVGVIQVRDRGALPRPPWMVVGAQMTRLVSIIIVLGLICTSCIGPAGMVRADAVKPGVDAVTQRHDAMLRGELDPASISEDDKRTFLRTSDLLRKTVDEAVKK